MPHCLKYGRAKIAARARHRREVGKNVRGEIVHNLEPIPERQLTVALIFAAGGSGALTADAVKMVMEAGVASVLGVRCWHERKESKVCVFQHGVHVPQRLRNQRKRRERKRVSE